MFYTFTLQNKETGKPVFDLTQIGVDAEDAEKRLKQFNFAETDWNKYELIPIEPVIKIEALGL